MVCLKKLLICSSKIESRIIKFISKQLKNTKLDGGIVAVSGGIDSSVALLLTVKALGSNNTRAITMPECDVTTEKDVIDVTSLTEALGVTCDRIDITPMLHVIFKNLQIYNLNNRIANGNIKARLRMIIPYYYANIFNCMVVGFTNKTELLTGFFTKYGDGGVDIMPLADLYKTQIRQLARHLKIPKRILDKPPSPGFWPGQTDEEELGVDYNTLDNILFLWEKGIPKNQIIKEIDVKQEIINNIIRRIKLNEHKRKLPAILKLNDYV